MLDELDELDELELDDCSLADRLDILFGRPWEGLKSSCHESDGTRTR